MLRPTPGAVPSFVQANLVVVPVAYALDFLMFCLANPKACPLLDVTDPHATAPREAARVAPGSDLATDVPRYRVWRAGELESEPRSVDELWSNEPVADGPLGASPLEPGADGRPLPMVGFLLGCSFSWEDELAAIGLPPAHVVAGTNVAMYETNVPNVKVGPFGGNLVVSMRPYLPADFEAVASLTGCYPGAHGAPVGYGAPDALGIADVSKPDFGNAVPIPHGAEPVFWACGVTPQSALMAARIPFAITHAPGYMFVTDVLDAELKAPCEPLDNLPQQ
ncbi:uncharacterized protein AMSG_12170 [Thecamonas trahens ATCC 50062]|uniref:DUF1445 domain-containing protein n=1 Tax=Thecamonas trahens ATCC 50062 TaxID=461836 RepID=A0A0L0DKA8_THETB|nr:hypothetical protein AMSG_12170 [Thecamonas trahens ATCC 50062]KNC52630.1 hypothetical protein AMSG_12170 [Thecamonas trahens ATCC 50062]|eukprot:XP_013755246.1 hypothetical protein AMSG_12170 [Thecamonas trahens ATCC 50062]